MIPQTGKTLRDFRWKNRVVVVNFEKSSIDSILVGNEREIEERKLLFVEFNKGEFIKASGPDAIDSADFFKVFSHTSSSTDWVLLGLDGGIKDSGTFEQFSLKLLFAEIDQMPIRASEIRGDN